MHNVEQQEAPDPNQEEAAQDCPPEYEHEKQHHWVDDHYYAYEEEEPYAEYDDYGEY